MKAYECEGQMSLFDMLADQKPKAEPNKWSAQEVPYEFTNPILNHLIEDLKEVFKGSKVEVQDYYVWPWVPKLGKRLSIEVENLPEDWDATEVIDKYMKEYQLEVSITNMGIFSEEMYLHITTFWKTPKHAERFDWKEEEQVAADNEEKKCQFSGHTCNKENLWDIADELDEVECQHTCCRECNEKLCGARCNGSEEPKAADQHPKAGVVGKWVEEHGKRIMFDDIQVGRYYIADYSTSSHDWFKIVYTKEKKEDRLMYVDAEKGVKGQWSWGNSYSCLTRKMYVDGDEETSSWWYEIPENYGEARPVKIKGICDDAYCPLCGFSLDELKYKDCEVCPECGQRIDWTPWHRCNDEPVAAVQTQQPCGMPCDVEWCSKECFLKRGRVWNHETGGWVKDAQGNTKKLEDRECDYEPEEYEDIYEEQEETESKRIEQKKFRDTFKPLLTDTDVFYYTDEELPTVEDVYCGLTTTDMDYLNARYVAYAKDRWWCWDSYRRQWSPAEDTKETVIIWYSIPEKYQSDSTLVYARELNGILGEDKPLAWR